MRRNRLYCGKCQGRKSKVVEIAGKPVATCDLCGANIPLVKDARGWHPVPQEKLSA